MGVEPHDYTAFTRRFATWPVAITLLLILLAIFVFLGLDIFLGWNL